MQKKHWLKKQLKTVRLQKSHTKSARLPKEKKLLPNVLPSQRKRKNVRYLRKTPKSEPLLLLIQKYRLIRRKKRPNPAAEGERPVRKPRPKTEGSSEEQPSRPHPKKRPAPSDRPLLKYAEGQEESREKVRPRPKKKRPEEAKPVHAIDNSSTRIISDEEDGLKITAPDLSTPEGEKEQTYSNIPPKHVREKREQEMRENYQNMLDEEDDDDERHFPVVLVVILIFLIIAAAAFAGYWFFLK